LKAAKGAERSEGQVIPEALREWFAKNGIALKKNNTPRQRVSARRRG
jgi:hypothetical protein